MRIFPPNYVAPSPPSQDVQKPPIIRLKRKRGQDDDIDFISVIADENDKAVLFRRVTPDQ